MAKESRPFLSKKVDPATCSFVLAADGTFTGAFPDYLAARDSGPTGLLMEGEGTWSMEWEEGHARVAMWLRKLNDISAYHGVMLEVEAQRHGFRLGFRIWGKDGGWFWFDRQETP